MARTPRVAHVGPDPGIGGGMAAVLQGLLDSPLAERYQFVVIPTYDGPRPLRRLGVFGYSLVRLVGWSARPGPRIVHVHATVRGSMYRKSICVFVAKLLRRPVVLHFHAGAGDLAEFHRGLGLARKAMIGTALRLADRVVSVSAASARELAQGFGCATVEVVPNAAPRPALPCSPTAGGALSMLYLGGFANPVKGGRVLLEALPTVLAELPEAEIVLAGAGKPPVGLDGVEEGGRTHPVGWLDAGEKADALCNCDIFVLPSTSEGLPVAMLEAMGYGRPIVASSVGGVPDVVTGEVDAILVPPGDPAALAEALVRLGRDQGLRDRLGQAALAAADRLSPEAVYHRLDLLYAELV